MVPIRFYVITNTPYNREALCNKFYYYYYYYYISQIELFHNSNYELWLLSPIWHHTSSSNHRPDYKWPCKISHCLADYSQSWVAYYNYNPASKEQQRINWLVSQQWMILEVLGMYVTLYYQVSWHIELEVLNKMFFTWSIWSYMRQLTCILNY